MNDPVTDYIERYSKLDAALVKVWEETVRKAHDLGISGDRHGARLLFECAARLDRLLDHPDRPHLSNARRQLEGAVLDVNGLR